MKTIIEKNKKWVQKMTQDNDVYFETLSKPQHPRFLWIGCSDSRVPPEVITNSYPGELFVHRNIANIVEGGDLNLFSVVQYGIEHLGIQKLVICGHTQCGGIKGALANQKLGGALDGWLYRLRPLITQNRGKIVEIATEDEKVDFLVEQNVRNQVLNLANSSVVQDHIQEDQKLEIHGVVFDLHHGNLKPIYSLASQNGEFREIEPEAF